MNSLPTRLLTLILALAALGGIANSAVFVVPEDDDLIRKAEAIVLATARESEGALDGRGQITTLTRFEVHEVIKGAIDPRESLVVRSLGGWYEGEGMIVTGSPQFREGDRVLLFLGKNSVGDWMTWGMALGKFDQVETPAGPAFIRGVDEGHLVGFSAATGDEHVETVRSPAFLDYVRDTVRGIDREPDYFVPGALAETIIANGEISASAVARTPYLLLAPDSSGNVMRRHTPNSTFPTCQEPPQGSNTFSLVTSGNNSAADGVLATQRAAEAWSNDLFSNVNISVSVGGSTDRQLESSPGDSVNDVILGGANSDIPKDETPNPLAYTRLFIHANTCHTEDGETFYSINTSDIIVDNAISGQTALDSIVTHEVGHALGIRHSNESGRFPNSNSAIMRLPQPTSQGANLCDWDLDALQTVYGTGPACRPFSITGPSNQSIFTNNNATLSVSASRSSCGSSTNATGVSYQWYRGPLNDTSNPVGTNSSSYTEFFSTPGTYSFWVRVFNSCDEERGSATVTVQDCNPPQITQQPQSTTIESGQTATLTVQAQGTAALSYSWYRATSPTRSNFVGSGPSYTTPALTQTTNYWVYITNPCGVAESNTATVTVTQGCVAPSIQTHPQSQTIETGQTATLTVVANGSTPLSYQWFREAGANDVMVGTNSPSFTTPALTTTTTYYVKVTNSCGNATSNPAVITVSGCVAPAITQQPASQSIPHGGTATLSVVATGDAPLSYQWLRIDGMMETPVGTNNSSFQTPPLTATTQYKVRVTNTCGNTNSVTVTITVVCSTPPAPTVSVSMAEVLSGDPYNVSWSPLTGVSTYELEESLTTGFESPQVFVVSGTFREFTKTVTEATRFYYRVRGIANCDGSKGGYSRVTSVAVVLADDDGNINVPEGTDTTVEFSFFVPGDGGSSKTSSSVTAANTSFVAESSEPWLTLTPSSGTIPPEGLTITGLAQTGDLPAGSNQAQVTVTSTSSDATVSASATSVFSSTASVSMVTPVTPTGKTTPSENSLIIPGVAHAGAGPGATWLSDARVANVGLLPLGYQLFYTPAGSGGGFATMKTDLTVRPGLTTALNDILKNWYSQGSTNEIALGVLEIRPPAPNPNLTEEAINLATIATSRTYNLSAQGSYGQFVPAIPFSRFVGKLNSLGNPAKLSLQGVTQNDAFRSNIRIIEASGQQATGILNIFDSAGNLLKGNIPWSAGPGQHIAFDRLLALQGITADNARVEIQVTSDTGRITAYAAVVDNQSDDPIQVSATEMTEVSGRQWVLPAMAHLEGLSSDGRINNWRSDVRVFNAGLVPVTATLTFYQQLNPSFTKTIQVTLQPGEVTALDNVLKTHFELEGTGGAIHITTPNDTPLVITARTYDDQPTGTYGQFIPAIQPSQGFGIGDRATHVLQLEQSANYRTNLGLTELTGNPVTLRISAIVPGAIAAISIQHPLQGNEFAQMTKVFDRLGIGTTFNGRITVQVVGGTGKVAIFGSVVDDTTGDPTYVPGQ